MVMGVDILWTKISGHTTHRYIHISTTYDLFILPFQIRLQAATVTGAHYNIIGIRWGSGWTEKHAFVGIKAARVIQSLKENYNLDVANLHAIGWRYILTHHEEQN